MNPRVSDMLYVILSIVRLRLLTLQVCILSYLGDSCRLQETRVKILRQTVGADAAARSRDVAERLRRRFRQEWLAVSASEQAAPECKVSHLISPERWPGE